MGENCSKDCNGGGEECRCSQVGDIYIFREKIKKATKAYDKIILS